MIMKPLAYIWMGCFFFSSIDYEEHRIYHEMPYIPYYATIPVATIATILVLLAIPAIIIVGACIMAMFHKI